MDLFEDKGNCVLRNVSPGFTSVSVSILYVAGQFIVLTAVDNSFLMLAVVVFAVLVLFMVVMVVVVFPVVLFDADS